GARGTCSRRRRRRTTALRSRAPRSQAPSFQTIWSCDPLRHAQQRAARPGIACDLLLARAELAADQLQARRELWRQDGEPGRLWIGLRFPLHEALDHAVLEGVKADHREAAA